MKYYNLPTAEQIASYHNGSLSLQDRQWIEAIMQQNPFVKEAVASFPIGQVKTVQQISKRVSSRVQRQYAEPRGFWSKYGVWIGLSTIALILAVGYQTTNKAEQRYFPDDNSSKEITLASLNENTEETTLEQTIIESKSAGETIKKEERKNNEEEASILPTEISDSEQINHENDQKVDVVNDEVHQNEEVGQEKLNLSGKLLKNIRGISVVSVDKKGLKKREVPEFPGGNIGLTNHFQSYITPVELQYGEPLYDAKATIHLEVGANGKLDQHSVNGYLHEVHQEQIKKAIEQLPQFKPGKGAVDFTLEVKFN